MLNVLKSRYFLIGVGAVLLIALVWVLGAWLHWSVTWRLVGVIGVLVVCLVALLISAVRANRAAADIERSIKRQAEDQLLSTRPDHRAEIEEVQQRLETAIQTLKTSKLGRGRRGKAALYALPWYLFIGPPGVGKTTAIANSGLNFPMGADRVRGVGGTRNCDWFFSDAAILLDTAGRYMTEEEDVEEWRAFLDTLKEHRSGRPINGVIVGMSVAELVDATIEDVEWHADRIRRRIDELIERLGVRFPVYLVFTKCDLLNGFVEFFGEMPRKEREQVWGHSFKQEEGAAHADAREHFEGAFDRLVQRLLGRRAEHLSRAMKRETRRRVYVFPLEFSAVKDKLSLFVSRLFQPNPYQERPIFRGFYFTSGTQEGVPLDRVIESIGQKFDLPPSEVGGHGLEPETKRYFLKGFFTDVVVPDQYLVSQTWKEAAKGRLLRAGAGVIAAAVLGLFVLGASQALVRSKLGLSEVEEAATAVRTVDWTATAALPEALTHMDRLRGVVAHLEHYEEDPPLLSWGLHRGGAVLDPARQLYYRKARAFFYAYPWHAMKQKLQQAVRPASAGSVAREGLYDALRAYLLMSTAAGRLGQEKDERVFLREYLVSLVDSTLPGRASVLVDREERFYQQAHRQVAAFVEGLSEQEVTPFEVDQSLVYRVRNLIYQPPSIEGLYRRIKQEGNAVLPPFTLAEVVPARDLRLFAAAPRVPGFFTKAGWENVAKAAIERQGEDLSAGDWVMGHTAEDLPAAMHDRERVVNELKARYFRDYVAQWKQFLAGIRFKPFGQLGAAERAMRRLASPTDSPLLYLLAHVTAQTTFQDPLVAGAREQLKESGQRAANRRARRITRNPRAGVDRGDERNAPTHPVDRSFQALHALNAEQAVSGGASSALYAAMEELARLRDQLSAMASGDGQEAAAFAARVLQEEGGALGAALRSIRSVLGRLNPQAREALFVEPLRLAWGAVLNAAQAHLNQRWREEVYAPFQAKLSELYPFDAHSDQDAPLQDVEQFFHPQTGVLATFYEEELTPFLGSDITPRTWQGRGLQLSSAARQALRHVQRLSEGLFEGGVLRLSFELQAELPARSEGAPPVDQVYLSVSGQAYPYRMGSYRPWKNYQWPGSSGVTLSVSTQTGDLAPKRIDGPWAWFRLLEEAQVQQTSSATYQLRWPFHREGRYTITVRYNLRSKSSANPFGDVEGFFSLRLPSTLN